MNNLNHLSFLAYRGGKANIVPEERLKRARNVRFSTIYPAGLFGTLTVALPGDTVEQTLLKTGDTLIVKNGSIVVWEGQIVGLIPNPYGRVGETLIEAVGKWGLYFERPGLNKRWVDNRLTEDVWPFTTGTTGDGDQQCTIGREDRLRFTPKGVAWANGDYAAVRYTMPYGETVKRLVYSYDLQEGAQAWEISAWRSTNGSSWTQMAGSETYAVGSTTVITATGTGSIDVTLATPSRYVELRFYARAGQTPVEDGTYYGEFSALEVFSETSSINLYEVANDIRAAMGISVDTTWLNSATMTYNLRPAFLTNGFERPASVLNRAIGFGDASGNPVGFGLYPSTWTTDGLPALFLETRPDLSNSTVYDYVVSTRTAEVPTIRFDESSVRNWIVVEYTDALGEKQSLHPDEVTTLKDTDSIALYGNSMEIIDAGYTDASGAQAYGERYLSQYKNPQISATGPIVVRDGLQNANGAYIPACQVRAGKRLKILDYPGQTNVQGLVAKTEYDSGNVSIYIGSPDDLTMFLVRNMQQKGAL